MPRLGCRRRRRRLADRQGARRERSELDVYLPSSRGVRGVSSVTGGGTTHPPTPRPPFGLFESTDGGATFSFIWDGGGGCPTTCNGTDPLATIRGVNHVALDPGWNGTTNKILYGGAVGPTGFPGSGGVCGSTDGGVP